MKRTGSAWVLALSAVAVGCGSLLGFDADYHPVEAATSGDGGSINLTVGSVSSGGDGGSGGAGGSSQACTAGAKRCSGQTPQSCDGQGTWVNGTACNPSGSVCVSGACLPLPPSCKGLPVTCGATGKESCCAGSVVTGGTFNRSNDPTATASVSDFRLDRFEVTVGRFRKFVEAYPGSRPKVGAGAQPRITGSGWTADFDASLPADAAALRAAVVTCDPPQSSGCNSTWTEKAGANEELPMNGLSWYEAFAFCAWDSGRLPTEAEWNYAAAGGSDQRAYPWGSTPVDRTHVNYACTGDGSEAQKCAITDILRVGSKPAGDGRYEQADLAGSVFEWNLDFYTNNYCTPCKDCECVIPTCTACFPSGSFRVLRGGSWASGEAELLTSNGAHNVTNSQSNRIFGSPAHRYDYVGVRCARNP